MAFPWCRRTVAIKTGQPYLVIPIFFENTHTPSSSSSCCEETQLLFIIIFFFGALLASSIFALQGTRASVSNKMIGRSIPCFFVCVKNLKKIQVEIQVPVCKRSGGISCGKVARRASKVFAEQTPIRSDMQIFWIVFIGIGGHWPGSICRLISNSIGKHLRTIKYK